MKKAIVYVSTSRYYASGLRELARDEEVCRKRAELQKWGVSRVFKRTPTSRTNVIDQMKAYCISNPGKIQHVIITLPSALSKSPEYYFRQVEEFRNLGIEIEIAMLMRKE